MGERVVIPFRPEIPEAQVGRSSLLNLAGVRGRECASESAAPASFSVEGLDRLLLQANRTAARSKQIAMRARQFLSECQSVSCAGASPKIPQ